MIQDLTEELQTIDQESLAEDLGSKVTQESDLEYEDSEILSLLDLSDESMTIYKISVCPPDVLN